MCDIAQEPTSEYLFQKLATDSLVLNLYIKEIFVKLDTNDLGAISGYFIVQFFEELALKLGTTPPLNLDIVLSMANISIQATKFYQVKEMQRAIKMLI